MDIDPQRRTDENCQKRDGQNSPDENAHVCNYRNLRL
jgi:hypothetical protein